MNRSEEWQLMERLGDPELTSPERKKLEALLMADPATRQRLQVYSLLRRWPELQAVGSDLPDPVRARYQILDRLHRELDQEATEKELIHWFPLFAGCSLFLVLGLAIFNFTRFGEVAGNTIEALLGLPAASIENVQLTNL